MRQFYLLIIWAFSSTLPAQYNCQQTRQLFAKMQTGPSINNNAKSDTFDIYHYDLELDFTDLPARYLRGRAVLHCRPLQAHPGHINLDLLLLQVDSVRQDGLPVSFSHNDTILQVQLAGNPGPGDSLSLEVFYQGSPPGDGSGWGGWLQSGGYFFNLGVGFAANPHTYGRAWHPCYDNFVERATYRFLVKTRSPRRPYCNRVRRGSFTPAFPQNRA